MQYNDKFLGLKYLLFVFFGVTATCSTVVSQNLNHPIGRIQFNAPQGAMPIARVGGGIRGTEGGNIVFTVLAPEQTGLTSQAQPTLYWYQSEPAEDMAFELTLNSGDETILDIQRDQAPDSGIQSINLEDTDVSLEPDVFYEWIIALIPDPNDRAKDITSSTLIKRTNITDESRDRLQQADPAKHPYIYAEAGMWFDTLKSFDQAIETDSDNDDLLLERLRLLEQVGLQKVADLENSKLSEVN